MAQEPVNYEAVLADLRAKRASIDDAIAAIEKLKGLGATPTGDAIVAEKAIDPSSIPEDAFFGLSIVEAAKKYLSIVKRKQSVKQIADALEHGGLHHTSSNFVATTATMLRRANDPELAKVGRGDWGLSAWYGNRRPKQEPVAKKAKPRRAAKRSGPERKPAQAAPSAPTAKDQPPINSGGPTLMDHVEAVLREHGGPMSVDDLLPKVMERAARPVAKATLVGMLAEKVRKGERFSRPAESTYALAG